MAGFQFDMKVGDVVWQPDESENYFELWDCYCIFNEGYKSIIQFFYRPWHPFCECKPEEAKSPLSVIRIVTPDGAAHAANKSYPDSLFRASKQTLDVTMGENRLVGKFDSKGKYEGLYVKMSEGAVAAELTYRVKIGAVKTTDRTDNLTYYNPATGKYFGWFEMAARSEIEGTLSVDGKSAKVTGLGYNLYNRGNLVLSDIVSRWFFTHIYAGDYTIMYNESTAGRRHSYAHFTPFIVWKGSDVLVSTYNFAAYGEEFAIDRVSGGPYPVEETFKATEGDIEVSGHLLPGVMAEAFRAADVPGFPFTQEKPGFHFFQFSDVDLQIRQGGQTERVKGQAVREFVWMHEWFPYQRPAQR